MTKNINSILVAPQESILKAVRRIDESSTQIVLVVDEDRRLLGTVTDGDVRRGLLRGVRLEDPVSRVMNSHPHTITGDMDRQAMLTLMGDLQLHQLPVVDQHGHVLALQVLDELIKTEHLDNWVVLMAGGLGTRLRPITETVPKPMIPVGGKPLLESIITTFVSQGFSNFYVSVNYKAEMVTDHFGDGSRFGARIEYLHEKERRGTAGALSLLPEPPRSPLIVMNGDLLTSVNFRHLLDFHRDHGALATMGVREYSMQVPYGVVETDQHRLTALTEKPVHHFFVNAGIYVVDPKVLQYIPDDRMFDMPDLFHELLNAKEPAATVFPIREYWLDIGRFDDLERAQADYDQFFFKAPAAL